MSYGKKQVSQSFEEYGNHFKLSTYVSDSTIYSKFISKLKCKTLCFQ